MELESLQKVEKTFRTINQAIWVVTTQFERRVAGLTATWIHQASIDRENPTVLIGLAPNHFTCELLHKSGLCSIHLLLPDQADLAYQFARPSSRNRDKFANIEWETNRVENGNNDSLIPRLSICHSALACQTLTVFHAGDRDYFLSEIVDIAVNDDGPFLCESDFFTKLSGEQLQDLKTDLNDDVEIQRPMMVDWLRSLKNSNK